MRLFALLTRLGKDEDGAALLEYTVLIAIMLVAVIATRSVGGSPAGGQRSTVLCRPSEDVNRPVHSRAVGLCGLCGLFLVAIQK